MDPGDDAAIVQAKKLTHCESPNDIFRLILELFGYCLDIRIHDRLFIRSDVKWPTTTYIKPIMAQVKRN